MKRKNNSLEQIVRKMKKISFKEAPFVRCAENKALKNRSILEGKSNKMKWKWQMSAS